MFSKWFLRDKGSNKVPNYFATDVWNLRIKNWGITQRLWYSEIYNGSNANPVRWMVSNFWLYVCQNSKFRWFWNTITFSAALVASNVINLKVNGVSMTPVTFTTDEATTLWAIGTQIKTQFPTLVIWSAVNVGTHSLSLILKDINTPAFITNIVVTLWASQPTGTSTENVMTLIGGIATDNRCRFITYGIYTIILTWANYPWVYDGSTLVQLSSSNMDSWTNPSFWTTFAWFTVINDSKMPNVLHISVPITTVAQTNAYDWKSTWAQTLTFQSPVLWCIGTLDNLWVFTEKTVQRMDKSNLSNTGGISGLYTTPFSSGYQLASPDSVVAAWDVIFFLTKNNKIGNINFKQYVSQPQMDIISNVFGNSIDEYMINSLDSDQSDSFALFDRQYNIVKFRCQSIDSTVDDVTVIWDIQNQTWLKDNNKFVSCGCILNDQIYTGSAFSFVVYADEFGNDDNWEWIERLYASSQMIIWWPADVKQFRGAQIAWQLNNLTNIRWQVLIDWSSVFDKTIYWSAIAPFALGLWIWWSAIWDQPIGWDLDNILTDLVDFERAIDTGWLRNVWKKIEQIWSWSEIWQNFILDYLNIIVRPRKRKLVTDIM